MHAQHKFSGYRPFLLVVLFFSLYLAYLILNPFLDTLVISIVLSSLFYPLQVYLTRLYRGRKNLAAFSIVFLATFVIAIPVFLFTSTLVAQGIQTVNQINDWIKAGNVQKISQDPRIVSYLAWAQERLTFIDLSKIDVAGNLLALSRNIGQFLLSKGATLLGNAASLVTHFFIMMFIMFYLVRDGAAMIEQGRKYSPLREEQEDAILNGARLVAKSVLLAAFLTAICQGIVGGIGVAIIGLPGLFWGAVMAFCSFIPIVGTALVWIPMVVYLILFGLWKSAIVLALWSIVLVGGIDNFLRPYLMKGGTKMPTFYIFLAIIGGVQYFGLTGILYGPLILSFAMIMLFIYGVEYKEDIAENKHGTPPCDPGQGAGAPQDSSGIVRHG